jgi:hypothetical protein
VMAALSEVVGNPNNPPSHRAAHAPEPTFNKNPIAVAASGA